MFKPVENYRKDMKHIVFCGIGGRPNDAECTRRFEAYIEKEGGGDYLVWAPKTDSNVLTEFGPEECPFMMSLGYNRVVQDEVYHCSLWILNSDEDSD